MMSEGGSDLRASTSSASLPSSVSVTDSNETNQSDVTLNMTRDDTTAGDPDDKRKDNLAETYIEDRGERFNKYVLESIRKTILSKGFLHRVKFLKEGRRKLGVFDRPDFTERCWQRDLFEGMPSMRHLPDGKKAIKWITYRQRIRKIFVNYKTEMTHKMKRAFMDCK